MHWTSLISRSALEVSVLNREIFRESSWWISRTTFFELDSIKFYSFFNTYSKSSSSSEGHVTAMPIILTALS